MSTKSPQSKRSSHKEQKKREITLLLEDQGPMESSAFIRFFPDLSLRAVNRYLDELLITGHIRKALSPGKRKNSKTYEYQNAYGAKMDIVSVALSHPLHQITLSTAGKTQNQCKSCWSEAESTRL